MFVEPISARRTALFGAHLNCGAKMVDFAGWEMPVQYEGMKNEVLATRENCGLFDVSHMGQLDARGDGVTQALNLVVSADWSQIEVGRAAYGLLLNAQSGVTDDVMGYHLGENHWLIVVNASRSDVDESHLHALLPPQISLSNRRENQAMIAIQGPRAEAILNALCDADLTNWKLRDAQNIEILGEKCVLTRGGYTGCDGFEWMGDAQTAPILWAKLLEGGATPCGLGARDVLRLEAGLPLYGHELRENWTPDESGVGFAAKTEKPEFFGRESLLKARQTPAKNTIRALKMLGRAIARENYVVTQNGVEIGVVTSGTLSPTLETGIALARLPRELAVGTEIEIQIRGAAHPARIVALPFVARSTRP